MTTYLRTWVVLLIISMTGCQKNGSERDSPALTSPSGNISLILETSSDGAISYSVSHHDQTIILPSRLLQFELLGADALGSGLEITDQLASSVSDEWELPWGEQRKVIDLHNALTLSLREKKGGRLAQIEFKAFDDGVAFRYHFPEQSGWTEAEITEERTEFNLTGDHDVWWIPGDWDIYEHLYNATKFSEIDALSKANHENLAQTSIPVNAVNTPVTMRTETGIHISFHEANLTDYAGMTLQVDPATHQMVSNLVGSANTKYKVKRQLPFSTPWRTIQVSADAPGLITSTMILNLNEPAKIKDISWFKPMKYVGIWWEMHVGKSTWDYKTPPSKNTSVSSSVGKPTHGATTQNAKKHIDFAAANQIGGVLIEGWNTGWDHWIGFEEREGVFDFVTPYPDYDLEEVVRYASEKNVSIIMHHETSSAPRTYEQQMDTAYSLMNKHGIHSVKTGYVGKIIPKGEYHHGQWMVNHYRKALETAAKYQVAINAHEPIKATGIRRTYPNAISREGLRGQEFNAWASDGGNPPAHLATVAFTRMLAGPIDYTPGIFNIKLDPYKKENQVNTTLAQQLALYVVIYSPVQMAADLIENYQDQPGFQFIRDVAVDWKKTIVLSGEVGQHVTIARQARKTDDWFVGSITNQDARQIEIKLDFLNPDAAYQMIIYQDGTDAHWDQNPTSLDIQTQEVRKGHALTLTLAEGGGTAISLIKK